MPRPIQLILGFLGGVLALAIIALGVGTGLNVLIDVGIREEYLIVDRGALAGAGAHSYSTGTETTPVD